jgi:hypothetical protein
MQGHHGLPCHLAPGGFTSSGGGSFTSAGVGGGTSSGGRGGTSLGSAGGDDSTSSLPRFLDDPLNAMCLLEEEEAFEFTSW